jgi:hypothetical protein
MTFGQKDGAQNFKSGVKKMLMSLLQMIKSPKMLSVFLGNVILKQDDV